jgi:hypothetical protein
LIEGKRRVEDQDIRGDGRREGEEEDQKQRCKDDGRKGWFITQKG